MMKFYIKYSMNTACRVLVNEHLEKLGVAFQIGDSSEVQIEEALTNEQRFQLNKDLGRYGIELYDDQQNLLVLRLKEAIVQLEQKVATRH